MTSTNTTSIVRSALWAAYGDALGFMTELADRPGVRRRTGQSEVTSLQAWTRRIGGKFGLDVKLPAGCYSDDTQLRLATARSIRSDRTLDVEVFAKVELPVWRAYALGAGRGTKAAAEALAKPNVHWPLNFYEGRGLRYIDSGGNGAAMRIQPHAWVASSDGDAVPLLREIIRNCVTTHGHPTAIVGACFHGLCVHHAIRERSVPQPKHLHGIASSLLDLPSVIASDEALATIWKPFWEQHASRPLFEAMNESQRQLKEELLRTESCLPRTGTPNAIRESYENAIGALEARRFEWKGSACKTAVLAAFLSIVGEADQQRALQVAANALETDTDSIASMAGAIMGGVASHDPPEDVLDIVYITSQAKHLAELKRGRTEQSHRYPDLMRWSPPKAALDVVGLRDGKLVIAGLGPATPVGDPIEDRGHTPSQFRWLQLDFGQTVLTKTRSDLKSLATESMPHERRDPNAAALRAAPEASLFQGSKTTSRGAFLDDPPSLDAATNEVIAAGFDPQMIGDLLLRYVASPMGVDGAVAFAAIVAKAKAARARRYRP